MKKDTFEEKEQVKAEQIRSEPIDHPDPMVDFARCKSCGAKLPGGEACPNCS